MNAVTLSVVVGEDRQLVIKLPEEIPVGPVELVIRPAPSIDQVALRAARDAARQKLLAAGVLATDLGIPDDLESLSDAALENLIRLPQGARASEELIDEDRGPH